MTEFLIGKTSTTNDNKPHNNAYIKRLPNPYYKDSIWKEWAINIDESKLLEFIKSLEEKVIITFNNDYNMWEIEIYDTYRE